MTRLAAWWQQVLDVAVTLAVHCGICHIDDRNWTAGNNRQEGRDGHHR